MTIIIPNKDFDFNKVKLGNPSGIQGGAYFSKILVNDDKLLIQTPKSTTKNGITTTDKKNCVDFMFDVEQTDFSEWIESFEKKIKELIYQRKDAWFTSEMCMEDIEYFFTPMTRAYKTKHYLLRAFEQKNKLFKSERKYNFGIYEENGEETTEDELTNANTQCMSLLEIQGLKFTSNSFRIEVSISQIMIVKEKMNEQCMIKKMHKEEPVVKLNEIQEVNIVDVPEIQEVNIIPSAQFNDDEPISLKQPNEVYYEIYREARKKAKIAKNVAIKAYLEAKRIKNTYILEDFDSDVSSSSEVEDGDNIFETI